MHGNSLQTFRSSWLIQTVFKFIIVITSLAWGLKMCSVIFVSVTEWNSAFRN